MTLLPGSRASFYVDGLFSDSSDRTLKGANVFFTDASTLINSVMDVVYCVVTDANGDTQYTLTPVSTPAIELETPANVYYVEEIDVTSFPDGDITLTWTGNLDGYTYTDTQTIKFNSAPAMVFVSGQTDTLEDFNVVLGQPKTFTCKLRDSLNNVVDSYATRLAFYDRLTGSIKEYVSGTLKAAGSGYWYVTHTLNSVDYAATIDRYEVVWQYQSSSGSAWYEVKNSRQELQIYTEVTDVQVGPITYCTNSYIRTLFPGIDGFLEDLNPNQAEREILLNAKREEVSARIYATVKNSRARAKRDLLKTWEAYEVYRSLLVSAHAFAKFAVEDTQIRQIDKMIQRIRYSIFGSVSTLRIGGRSNA